MQIASATQLFQASEIHQQQHKRIEISTPTAATQTIERAAESESKASDEQNEDGQQFSAKESIGTVKRILEQLSSGKLLSWLDGNAFEKIQAQQQQQESVTRSNPVQGQSSTVLNFDYRYQAVSASFSGAVSLADGSVSAFSFEFSMQEEYMSLSATTETKLTDPLVVSLTGQAFQWTGQFAQFDLKQTGQSQALPKLAAGQYYLSYDQNQDGRINHGGELFGPRTGAGFAELSMLDEDGDGFIDSDDSAFNQLGLWRPGESPLTLAQANIGAISAQSIATSFGLYDGNALMARIARSGIFLDSQGQAGLVQQVDFSA